MYARPDMREARESHPLKPTRREWADLLGMDETRYQRIEAGQVGVRPETAIAVSRRLHLRVRDLFIVEPVEAVDAVDALNAPARG